MTTTNTKPEEIDLPPPPLCSPDWFYPWACGTAIPRPTWQEADRSGFDAKTGVILVDRRGVTRTTLRHLLAHYLFHLAATGKLPASALEEGIKAIAGRLVAAEDCTNCMSPERGID